MKASAALTAFVYAKDFTPTRDAATNAALPPSLHWPKATLANYIPNQYATWKMWTSAIFTNSLLTCASRRQRQQASY